MYYSSSIVLLLCPVRGIYILSFYARPILHYSHYCALATPWANEPGSEALSESQKVRPFNYNGEVVECSTGVLSSTAPTMRWDGVLVPFF